MSSYRNLSLSMNLSHCDSMVANSYAKLVENFANYFFKTESKNKYFIILNCTRLMLEKSLEVIQKGRPSGFSLET